MRWVRPGCWGRARLRCLGVDERTGMFGLHLQLDSMLRFLEKQGFRASAAQPEMFQPVSTLGVAVRPRRERVEDKNTPLPEVPERFRALGVRAMIQHRNVLQIRPDPRVGAENDDFLIQGQRMTLRFPLKFLS